jgi:uncharacterized protein YndB with AHSA1/START domain
MATQPSFSIRRRVHAAPTKVYRAWTDPAQIARWFGPNGADTVEAEADPRVGGRYRVRFRGSDGEQHDVSGVYRDVVPNERLVFTWAWRTMPERESLVTVALERDGDGTVLTLTQERFFDEGARDRHREGWSEALEKLAACAAAA